MMFRERFVDPMPANLKAARIRELIKTDKVFKINFFNRSRQLGKMFAQCNPTTLIGLVVRNDQSV